MIVDRGEVPSQITFSTSDADTGQLRRILYRWLPDALELFARKNRQYGENEFELGAAAQYPEIHRKVNMLRRILWNHEDVESIDSATELIHDLIGHSLMLLDCIRRGEDEDRVPPLGYRGHHTYLTTQEIAGVTFFAAQQKVVPLPEPTSDEARCLMYYGDMDLAENDNKRCLGVDGHEGLPWDATEVTSRGGATIPRALPVNLGDEGPWEWHINRDQEAWK